MDMSIKNYTNEVANILGAEAREIPKNNGVKQHAILIKDEGANLCPLIYVDGFFEAGMTVHETADKVQEMFEDLSIPAVVREHSIPLTFEEARPNIFLKLVNMNQENIALGDFIPATDYYDEFHDLIILPRLKVGENKDGIASAAINQSLLDLWGTDMTTVVNIGVMNLEGTTSIQSLPAVLSLLCPIDLDMTVETCTQDILIVSNKQNINGAINIITAIDELYKRFPEGFTVLPSSVHEVIVVSNDSFAHSSEMVSMVREINATVVRPEEVLSNNIYTFR